MLLWQRNTDHFCISNCFCALDNDYFDDEAFQPQQRDQKNIVRRRLSWEADVKLVNRLSVSVQEPQVFIWQRRQVSALNSCWHAVLLTGAPLPVWFEPVKILFVRDCKRKMASRHIPGDKVVNLITQWVLHARVFVVSATQTCIFDLYADVCQSYIYSMDHIVT